MKKYLITGISGFVAYHFVNELSKNAEYAEILGVSKTAPSWDLEHFKNLKIRFKALDLRNQTEIKALLNNFKPDYIIHLASNSSVGYSWENPIESFNNNTNIFLNLIEVVRNLNISCRILSIGSSEEYGNVSESELPLRETSLLKPLSPYAVARVSQEMMSKVYVEGYGLDIILTRSFNHIGTHQLDHFVIPSFAKQIALIKIGKIKPEITVGNLAIIRDFVDVRDVVSAYLLLLKNGMAGEIYNICSNNGNSLGEILMLMKSYSNIDFHTIIDANLIRPKDNLKIIGSNEKIKTEINWQPKIGLNASIENICDFWLSVINNNKFLYETSN